MVSGQHDCAVRTPLDRTLGLSLSSVSCASAGLLFLLGSDVPECREVSDSVCGLRLELYRYR
eukprot:5217006-Prymnesium_polylepis.1